MLEVYQSHPLHIEMLGPVEFEILFINSKSLNGVCLDYGIALATLTDGVVVLDFLPSGIPSYVRFGLDYSSLKIWSPTKDEHLISQVINAYSINLSGYSNEEALRTIVYSKFGEKFPIPKMKKA